MVRYLRLWAQFLKMSVMADLEYRLNMILRFIGEFVWYLAQLSTFEVIYTHTTLIQGWDVNAMRVFMGCLFLVDVIYMFFIQENMEHFSSMVRKGDLDLYLVKPINSQFMVSCRKVSSVYLLNMFVVLIYLSWAVSQLQTMVTPLQIALFVVLLICGFLICYSIRFFMASLAVIFVNTTSLQFLWHQIYRLGTRPDIVYPRTLRIVLLTILPVGFFASVPSRILVEGLDPRLLVASVAAALFGLLFSSWFWNRALKSYSSASS